MGAFMKLSYFELLSPEPVSIPEIGGILSPKLRDISLLGYPAYQNYLAVLLMDTAEYFTMAGYSEQYRSLSEEEKAQIDLFGLLTANEQTLALLQDMLNFFIRENVLYSPEHKGFAVQDSGKTIGWITKDNYPEVCGLICQRICIHSRQKEDPSKVKSKKAWEIMKKLQKGRMEKAKQAAPDENMELGNIISAVANKSNSLHIINIWDLTVFQLWDCFSRLSNNSIYDIQSMSVAAWGDKEKHFDPSAWFQRINR